MIIKTVPCNGHNYTDILLHSWAHTHLRVNMPEDIFCQADTPQCLDQ